MNKREKHYISWVVLILYLCSFIAYSAYVDKTTAMKEQKRYSDASMSDEFAEDKVLVVLSNAESLKFKTYCPEDFSEINCLHVRDLTEYSTDLVKQKIANTQSYQKRV